MGRYRVQDDSVTLRGKGHPKYSGKSVGRRGEDQIKKSAEPGRITHHESDHRVVGTSTLRDMTSVNPSEPIDPRMPTLIG
jgi:hypothetical protein